MQFEYLIQAIKLKRCSRIYHMNKFDNTNINATSTIYDNYPSIGER
jgi:hypothetical protein